MSYAEWDVDAHAYDEVRYEEHRERWGWIDDDTDSGASSSPHASSPSDANPSDAPEETQEAV